MEPTTNDKIYNQLGGRRTYGIVFSTNLTMERFCNHYASATAEDKLALRYQEMRMALKN